MDADDKHGCPDGDGFTWPPRLTREEYEAQFEALDALMRVNEDARAGAALTPEQARALLAEGKRIADKRRKAREARERDPERAR